MTKPIKAYALKLNENIVADTVSSKRFIAELNAADLGYYKTAQKRGKRVIVKVEIREVEG